MSSDEYGSSSKRTRASGEVLDFLLQEFENNHNPSPEQRKEISDKTNMSEKAVRIWFQNRRAKLRKFERLNKTGDSSFGKKLGGGSSSGSIISGHNDHQNPKGSNRSPFGDVFISINEKYCFIDCSSLSVGSWQRIKTGKHDTKLLENELVNLSPFTLNKVMSNADLLVLLSKKNLEINYFFSAAANDSKVLFRIFYPISSIIKCSLLDNNINKENNELRLCLSHEPKFSVFFFNGINSNANQWSICEDFSEDQQVSAAHGSDGDDVIPHVLVGVKNSLQYLNSFILENNQMAPQAANYHPHIQLNPSHFDSEAHSAGNFQFTTDNDSLWNNEKHSPLGDANADLSHMTSMSQKDNPKFSHETHYTSSNALNEEADYSYNEIFRANTPDFFATEHTPTSGALNVTLHTTENEDERDDKEGNEEVNENLINSPSTDLNSYTHQAQLSSISNADVFNEGVSSATQIDLPLEFSLNADFSMTGLDNQKNNYSSNSSTNNQLDNFIDFNEGST